MKFIPIFMLIVLFANPLYCLWEEFAGPYYFRWKALGKCRDASQNRIDVPIKLRRVNRTHKAYRNNVTFPFDLTNEYNINVVVHTKGISGHSWNSLMDITQTYCDFISTYCQEFTTELFESAGHKYECPVKKGTYAMDYLIPDVHCNVFPAFPVFPYGDCRLEMAVHSVKGKTYVRELCFAVYFESRPLYEIRGGCPKRPK